MCDSIHAVLFGRELVADRAQPPSAVAPSADERARLPVRSVRSAAAARDYLIDRVLLAFEYAHSHRHTPGVACCGAHKWTNDWTR